MHLHDGHHRGRLLHSFCPAAAAPLALLVVIVSPCGTRLLRCPGGDIKRSEGRQEIPPGGGEILHAEFRRQFGLVVLVLLVVACGGLGATDRTARLV